jgi:uncharacterized iron-regulated membrane protein
MKTWQMWVQHPQRVWLRQMIFQAHYLIGAVLSMYVFAISVSGSILVFRNELSRHVSVQWMLRLHTNLLHGVTGRAANGVGAAFLAFLCVTGIVLWWPGIAHWRRSLIISWSVHLPRLLWDIYTVRSGSGVCCPSFCGQSLGSICATVQRLSAA